MKKIWIVVTILVSLGVLAALGLVGLGALFVFSTEDLPVTTGDEVLVVRAEELAPWFEDFAPAASYESLEKLRYADGSEELTYEYDSPLDDEPYFQVVVSWEKNRADARMTSQIQWSAAILGMNIADTEVDIEEDDEYYSVGDHCRFGVMTYDGEPVGNLLVATKGRTVYYFLIAGFLLDDPDLWHELFDERIEGLEDL